MFNPLLPDLSKVKNDEIELKISELMKKYLIAARSGQGIVCSQIQVILEAYKTEQQKRYIETQQKALRQNKNLDDYINVDN